MKAFPTTVELQELLFKSDVFKKAAEEWAGPAGVPTAMATWIADHPLDASFQPNNPSRLANHQSMALKAAQEVCGPKQYQLTSGLATHLAAIVKAAASAAAPVLTSGEKAFISAFGGCALESSSPGTLHQLWHAAPLVEPSFKDLEAAGHPLGADILVLPAPCLTTLCRDEHHALWVADPTRYLFSEKEPEGYYEVDDEGVWDTRPTSAKIFEAKHTTIETVISDKGKEVKARVRAPWLKEIKSFSRRTYDYGSKLPLVIVAGIPCKNEYVASRLEPVAGNWDMYRTLILNLVAEGRPWPVELDEVRVGQLEARVCSLKAEVELLAAEQGRRKRVVSIKATKAMSALRMKLSDAEAAVAANEQAKKDLAAFNYFMDWLARPMQELFYKGKTFRMGTSIWCHGEEGSGKSLLYDALVECYGESNCFKLTQALLDGKFSGHMRGKLLILGNEVTSSSNKGEETGNKLKDWITDNKLAIEGKGVDGVEERNHFNALFFSNSKTPAFLGPSDRRHNFFKQTTVLEKKFPGLGKAIYEDRTGAQTQLKAFYNELLTRKCQVGYQQLFENESRAEQRIEAEDSLSKFLRGVRKWGWDEMAQGWLNGPRTAGEDRSLYAYGAVLSGTMVTVYNYWCRTNNTRPEQYPGRKFKKVMRELEMTFEEVTVGRERLLGFKNITGVQPPTKLPEGLHSSSAEKELEPSGAGG